MAEEVKLFGTWSSPFSRRIELAMKLKGIPFEYIEEDLQNKSAELLQYNPIHKKIPFLVHNGKPIDETWIKNPILPQDSYQKAMARFWARSLDDKVIPTGRKAHIDAENENSH